MSPETASLIRELAAQFGVATDQLINLFVPRVIASSIAWIVVGAAIYVGAYFAIRKAASVEDHYDRDYALTITWIVAVVICGIGTIAAATSIADLASPRAAAILEILHAIRGE